VSTIRAEASPRLCRGVRLSFDRVRGRHVVLYPEGVLFPNDTAVAVLLRCDGSASLAAIVAGLGVCYRGVSSAEVCSLVERLVVRGLVEVSGPGAVAAG
jgi:pyrroloquinoline quinone biosynthesis protein D